MKFPKGDNGIGDTMVTIRLSGKMDQCKAWATHCLTRWSHSTHMLRTRRVLIVWWLWVVGKCITYTKTNSHCRFSPLNARSKKTSQRKHHAHAQQQWATTVIFRFTLLHTALLPLPFPTKTLEQLLPHFPWQHYKKLQPQTTSSYDNSLILP